jgi:hypothetical protein
MSKGRMQFGGSSKYTKIILMHAIFLTVTFLSTTYLGAFAAGPRSALTASVVAQFRETMSPWAFIMCRRANHSLLRLQRVDMIFLFSSS